MQGSVPPLITPFRSGEIDLETFERLAIRQIECGSDGIAVAGTSGEPAALTLRERSALFRSAKAVVPEDKLLIAATGAESLAATIELTRDAAALGVDAAMVVTPAFSKPSQRALTEYYRRVAESVDIPVLLYNIPGRTGVALDSATVLSLAHNVPNIVGVKHSSTDLAFVSDIVRDAPANFSLFCGFEELCLPMLAIGAMGVMSAVANVLPREVADLCACMRDGRVAKAREIHLAVLEISRAVFWDTNPVPIKYIMHRLGLLDDPSPRPPLLEPDSQLAERLNTLIQGENLVFRSNEQGTTRSPLATV